MEDLTLYENFIDVEDVKLFIDDYVILKEIIERNSKHIVDIIVISSREKVCVKIIIRFNKKKGELT